jgi:16S rRNA (uracil1498-N3)-methyltransferase
MARLEPMRQPGARRLYVPEIPDTGLDVVLRGPSRRYVRNVLRMGRGDSLVLFDGSGMEYPARIIDATTRNVTIRILGKHPGRSESPIHIRVGMGLLKANKMDLVIQKISELGVQEVCPVAARRAVPDLDPDRAEQRRERWQTIAREASRQSGRCAVADVGQVSSLDEFVGRSEDADLSLLFTTEATRPLDELAVQQDIRPGRVLLLVGPEGGFSAEEEQIAQGRGFLPVGLGPRVLRAETAAILAVGLVQYAFGDLGGNRSDTQLTRENIAEEEE